MFEDSLVESSGALKAKSSRYMWVTGAFNAAVVVVMILIPLLYPEALPKTAITAMLSAPPPPPPASPRPPVVARTVRVTPQLDAYTAPTRVPTSIAEIHDDPPPISDTGVVSMSGGRGSDNDVPDALGLGVAPPPIVKVTPPKSAVPTHVSSGVVAGNKLSGSTPVYPAIAKAAHVSGSVVLHAIISKTGTIQSLQVVSGRDMLRASAIGAVQDWKYKPYLLNGEPTEVDTTITVNFSIGG
jgi:protein TonB